MPVYEYKCLKCNKIFSLLQSLSPVDNNTECPRCSSKEVKKIFSSFSCRSGSETKSSSLPAPNFGGGGG
ncbi:MAG: zinc ribbon domain-containing protein [Thermodesulfovibrionia bacterium]|nr:zinc ribbon domain-containing protein [Thermodesulfovibrionia bacterium]